MTIKVSTYLMFQLKSSLTASPCVPAGSQAMPTSMPPPRKLPQRSWAASIPTILTHSALNILLLPSPTPGLMPGLAGSYLCSPLERFLGSVIMRRHLQRIIQQETVRFKFKWACGYVTAPCLSTQEQTEMLQIK